MEPILSQPYGPSWPVTGIALPFFLVCDLISYSGTLYRRNKTEDQMDSQRLSQIQGLVMDKVTQACFSLSTSVFPANYNSMNAPPVAGTIHPFVAAVQKDSSLTLLIKKIK
jgi:hypothetical protein